MMVVPWFYLTVIIIEKSLELLVLALMQIAPLCGRTSVLLLELTVLDARIDKYDVSRRNGLGLSRSW